MNNKIKLSVKQQVVRYQILLGSVKRIKHFFSFLCVIHRLSFVDFWYGSIETAASTQPKPSTSGTALAISNTMRIQKTVCKIVELIVILKCGSGSRNPQLRVMLFYVTVSI